MAVRMCFALLALFVTNISAYNILTVLAMSVGSHFLYLSKIGEHLTRKGHSVTLLVAENHNDLNKTFGHGNVFTVEKYHSAMDEDMFLRVWDAMNELLQGNMYFQRATSLLNDAMFTDCRTVLLDADLMQRLEQSKFDIVIGDNVTPCRALIADKLSLPFITVSTNRPLPSFDTYLLNMPTPLSYVPGFVSGLTDRMTLWERLTNVVNHAVVHLAVNLLLLPPYNRLKQECDIDRDVSIVESLSKSQLTIFGMDWDVDFPCPMMPNTVRIGGLLAKPATPLAEEWEEFVRSAADIGLVVFSFGSLIDLSHNSVKSEIVFSALARLSQKVAIKYDGTPPSTLGNNTKLSKWIPQNDLLGHPNTKVFVAHGGLNGIYEAVYHGVPMVGIPIYDDHFDNFARLRSKGMVETVEIGTLTSDGLFDAIIKVITNTRYKANAEKISRIHRDKPMSASDTAVFWIEHVIKHGGQHLRAEAFNLNFSQYFLMDVFAFLFIALITVFILVKMFFFLMCILCCKRNSQKQKSD
ncbi:UDP-glucuronosyltransferase 2B15-like [Saccoglossus kowalevskii]|uniref:UDP-glucuronosyltransferase n=1 Tax=Saccoglossus kowalevskii TaxID=10224 RepID=A0ABM0GM78_SACKO|nr:PREDICTED: UDP-glucuronosyltransferase 2B15-like [Saccoglossus kowalevskii]